MKLAIIPFIILIGLMLFLFSLLFVPELLAEKVTGYEVCYYYELQFDVFVCSDFDEFGDAIGEAEIVKTNKLVTKIIARKPLNG